MSVSIISSPINLFIWEVTLEIVGTEFEMNMVIVDVSC